MSAGNTRATGRRRASIPNSDTETFIALKCAIDNWRRAGVPFFLRTGKRLAEGQRIISLAFREPPKSMFPVGSGVGAQGPDHLTFDLAIGSMFALLGVIFVDLLVTWHLPWWLALLVVVLGGIVLGAVHGFLVTRLRLQPFIVTLCGLLIYRGVARYYTNDGTAGFEFGQTFPTLEWLTTGRTLGVPHSFIMFLAVAAVMAVVLHRSVFGRYLFAVGKNEEAARYSGIRTQRIVAAAYIISGGLAGLSSIYLAMYTRSISPASHGNFYELYAIAAAVLGGCSLRGGEGSILGIVLGAILLQILQNLVNLLGIPSSLNFAVMGTVILIGVVADQQLTRLRTCRDRR